MRTIILIFCIFISIWWVSINAAKSIAKEGIPFWNFVVMSIGLTGVVTYFLGLW